MLLWLLGAIASPSSAKEQPCTKREVAGVLRAAEHGSAPAQNRLGDLYFGGLCVSKNYTEAARWYRKSAEQGNDLAQFHLGMMFSEGLDLPQDWGEAAHWFRLSAEQGNRQSQFALGALYDNGRGVEKDPVLAYQWILLSGPGENHRSERVLQTMSRKMTSEQVKDAEERARGWRTAPPGLSTSAKQKFD
ncbi:MAG TPA: tetratricopeptide repeat protein [Bryobacteraceae bacterium]